MDLILFLKLATPIRCCMDAAASSKEPCVRLGTHNHDHITYLQIGILRSHTFCKIMSSEMADGSLSHVGFCGNGRLWRWLLDVY